MADIFSADIEEKLEIKDGMTQKEIDRINTLKAQRESEKALIDDMMSTSCVKDDSIKFINKKNKNKK
jgi:hypothetical protein